MEHKRLKRILDLSRRVERARKGELSSARHAENLALQDLERRKGEERMHLRALEEQCDLDVQALIDRARGLSLAATRVHEARVLHSARDHEVQRHETAVIDATRDVRKFEILIDRAHQERRLQAKNAEQQMLDETRRAPKRPS
jgi:flagellar biosynthesis chaperone FliJ